MRKNFDFGLDLSFAYTHSKSRSYSDGIGDQVTSAYKTNTYSVNGINEHELGYGTYVAPDRILATVGYKKEYGKHFATSVSLLYEHGDIAVTHILSLVMLLVMRVQIAYCIFLQHVKNWITGSLVMLLLILLHNKEMISGIILTKINI